MRILIFNVIIILVWLFGKPFIPTNQEARRETKKIIRKQLTEHLRNDNK